MGKYLKAVLMTISFLMIFAATGFAWREMYDQAAWLGVLAVFNYLLAMDN